MQNIFTQTIGFASAAFASGSLLLMYVARTMSLTQMQIRGLWFVAVILWLVFLWWSHWFFPFSKKSFFFHISTAIAFVSLFSLIEINFVLWFLVLLCGGVFLFLWQWSWMEVGHSTRFEFKTWRRLVMMVWVFNMYAWFTALFGLHLFYPELPLIVLATVAGLFAAFGAETIWSFYFKENMRKHALWMTVLGLIILESMWTIALLPLGYLALGLFLTWIWYLGQLFIRFHLSKGGIIWKKQRRFLAANVMLFSSILYIVRWI